MKSSRLFVIGIATIVALIGIGTILGALLPAYVLWYVGITAFAVAILALAWFFYTGHKEETVEKKKSNDEQSSQKK